MKRFPQLTLRDLFWLVLVCGLGIALWLERSALASVRAENQSIKQSLADANQDLATLGTAIRGAGYSIIVTSGRISGVVKVHGFSGFN